MIYTYLSELLVRFRDYPPKRVRLQPAPGTATRADVQRLRNRRRHLGPAEFCELIDGVLVDKPRSYLGDVITAELTEQLVSTVRRGDVTGGGMGLVTCGHNIRIPAVCYHTGRVVSASGAEVIDPDSTPELVAEVVVPGNTAGELAEKRRDYFFAGVRLVWIIDPRARTVEVFTGPDQLTTLTDADTLTGGDVLPGFAVPVAQLLMGGQTGSTP